MPADRQQLVRLTSAVTAAATTAWFSLNRVLTFDESYWLAMARQMLDGTVLYVDVIDNKGPLLYLTFAFLELMPGSFEIWRAVAVAASAGLIAYMGAGLLQSLGVEELSASVIASVTALHAVVLSSFALTTEILSSVLVVSAFRFKSTRPTVALTCVLFAAGIDPRSLLFAIPLAAALGRTGLRRPGVKALGLAAIGALILVFMLDPLRFSLVELSTVTRFDDSWVPAQQVFVAAVAALPLVGLAITSRIRLEAAWQPVFIVIAVAIGAVSLFHFSHYWVYLGLVPLVLQTQSRNVALTAVAMFVLVAPALIIQDIDIDRDQRQWDHATETAALVANAGDGSRVLVWSEFPQVTLQVGGRSDLPTPSINILGWDTSRRDDFLAELRVSASSADVILVDAPVTGSSPEQEPFATIRSAVEAAGCDVSQERPFACVRGAPSAEASSLRSAS